MGSSLHTAIVSMDKVKRFDTSVSCDSLEAGLEVKLMVKAKLAKTGERGIAYRATLCIPNPEKTCYDLVATGSWAEKTRGHLSAAETLEDIGR